MLRAFTILLFLLPCLSLADDAAWTVVGGAGSFAKNTQIRMASEVVRIELHPGRSHFHADFVFRNEGPRTSVQMAFPEEVHGLGKGGAISRFHSLVDGQAVRTTRHKLSKTKSKYNAEYVAVWLKRVRFGRGQTRRVSVDYWAKNGDIGDYVMNTYVLKTGATWKGKIGAAKIIVDWTDMNDTSRPDFYWESDGKVNGADHYRILGARRFQFAIGDVEPHFDLVMRWTNTPWNFKVNGVEAVWGPYDDNRAPLIWGSRTDPLVAAVAVPNIFGEASDKEYDPYKLWLSFDAGKHRVHMEPKGIVVIDGKRHHLRRGYRKRGARQAIYLRDLVTLLHGKMRFDRAWNMMRVTIPRS